MKKWYIKIVMKQKYVVVRDINICFADSSLSAMRPPASGTAFQTIFELRILTKNSRDETAPGVGRTTV